MKEAGDQKNAYKKMIAEKRMDGIYCMMCLKKASCKESTQKEQGRAMNKRGRENAE